MGGQNFYKGVSLERQATLNPNRLRDGQQMFNKLTEYRDNLEWKTNKSKKEKNGFLIYGNKLVCFVYIFFKPICFVCKFSEPVNI